MSMNGELPKNWGWVSLSEACAINPGVDTSTVDDGDLVSFVPMAAVEAGTGRLDVSQVRPLADVRRGYTAFQDGDVIFAKITPCMENGKIAVASSLTSGIAFGSTEFHVLRPTQSVDAHFLYHAISRESFRREAREHMTGTAGQLRVPAKFLAQSRFLLPPLAEQRRIVAAIEELFTRLDAGVAALKRAQAALKRYRAAVLKAAVEGKLTEEWRAAHPDVEPASNLLTRILAERRARWEADLHAKGKDPAKAKYEEPNTPDTASLPELPEGWCWATLDQSGFLNRGRFSVRPRNDPRYYGGSYPFIQIGDLPVDGGPIRSFKQTLNEDGIKVSRTFAPGTVVISIAAAIGRVGLLTFESCFPDSLVGLTCTPALIAQYAEMYVRTQTDYLKRQSYASGGQPNISLPVLESLPIALPPLAEQEQIVAEVERRLSVVSELEGTVVANLKRAERLRQSILERAFSGRLVPQGPTDEPASALLERITDRKGAEMKREQLNML